MSHFSALQRPFRYDGGHAFVADISASLRPTALRDGTVFLVQEDDRELGPGDSPHQQIRDHGGGRFSVWKDAIYFSASDGSNCETNGRTYSVCALDLSEGSSLLETTIEHLGQDSAQLLRAVACNAASNNTVFANFFRYYHNISYWLNRAGLSAPKAMLEIGCGNTPFAALRFLLEGVERYVANEIMPIKAAFPSQLISDLRICCEQIDPDLAARWDRVFVSGKDGTISVRGLETHPETPFEEIDVDGPFEFITSTSVMEHVMKADAVFAKMASLTASGGFVYHSIDLRDHRDFSRPLDFLRMTDREYSQRATENRLRASDFSALFDKHGFELVEGRWYMLTEGGELKWTQEPFRTLPGVTVEDRKTFAGRFADMDLHDLSTVAIQWLCRKR